jgi:hypothetical protein
VTYHWKVLEESYNFVVEKTLIKTQMQKLWSYKIFNTFASRGKMGKCSSNYKVIALLRTFPMIGQKTI